MLIITICCGRLYFNITLHIVLLMFPFVHWSSSHRTVDEDLSCYLCYVYFHFTHHASVAVWISSIVLLLKFNCCQVVCVRACVCRFFFITAYHCCICVQWELETMFARALIHSFALYYWCSFASDKIWQNSKWTVPLEAYLWVYEQTQQFVCPCVVCLLFRSCKCLYHYGRSNRKDIAAYKTYHVNVRDVMYR